MNSHPAKRRTTGLEPRIWSSVIRNLQLPVENAGLDFHQLLGECGIDSATLEHPHGQVLLERYIRFINTVAERAEDPLAGIRMGQEVGPEVLGAVGFLFITSRTLGDAMRSLCFYQRLFQDGTSLLFYPSGDDYVYAYSLYDIQGLNVRQDVEFSIAFSLRLIRIFSNNRTRIKRITFKHAPRVHPASYEHLLGAPCHFMQDINSIVLGPEGINDRSNRHDPNLEQILRDYLDQDVQEKRHLRTLADRVKQTIHNDVGPRLVTVDRIAEELGLSSATLYRRLREEGTTFRELWRSVYYDLATRYLRESTLSVAQIGESLGFSSPAGFSRAYCQWSGGRSPRQVRSQ